MEYIKGELVGTEPITTAEVVQSLRLDYYDATEIARLITSAREAAEDYCNTDFVLKKYSIFSDTIICEFTSKRKPVKQIDTVTIYDNADTPATVTANYKLAAGNRIIQVAIPTITNPRLYDAIKFEVQSGYTVIPSKVKDAMLWYCYNLYYKADMALWLPAFHSLLSTIRNRPA